MVVVFRKNLWAPIARKDTRSLILSKALSILLDDFQDLNRQTFNKIGGGTGEFIAFADTRLNFDDEATDKLSQVAEFISAVALFSLKKDDALEIDNRTFEDIEITEENAAFFIYGAQSMGAAIVTAKQARDAIASDVKNRQDKRIKYLIEAAGLTGDLFFYDTPDDFYKDFQAVELP